MEKICYHKPGYDKHEIVAHLHVVVVNLHHCKQCRQRAPHQPAPPVGHHYTGYYRRDICQGHEFPDMAGTDYDDEIGGKAPGNRPDKPVVPSDFKCRHKDKEPCHHHEKQVGRGG